MNHYRYSFNGMENDGEIKGSGNSIDFGARIYDPRVGRWLSTDPQDFNYPNQSPFNFSLNSPIMFNDPNGEDAIVTIDRSTSIPTITISTKIYVTGTGFDQTTIDNLNIISKQVFMPVDKPFVYTDQSGQEYLVKIDVQYINVQGDEEFLNSMNTSQEQINNFSAPTQQSDGNGLPIGANYINVTNDPIVDGQSSASKAFSIADIDLNMDVPKTSSLESRVIFTIIHETGHLLGLSDRYSTGSKGQSTPLPGYENDFMASNCDTGGNPADDGIVMVHDNTDEGVSRDQYFIGSILESINSGTVVPTVNTMNVKSYSLYEILDWGNINENDGYNAGNADIGDPSLAP